MENGSSIRRSLRIERWLKARIYTQNYNVKEEHGRDDAGQTASICILEFTCASFSSFYRSKIHLALVSLNPLMVSTKCSKFELQRLHLHIHCGICCLRDKRQMTKPPHPMNKEAKKKCIKMTLLS